MAMGTPQKGASSSGASVDARERVSGLESYVGSSDASLATQDVIRDRVITMQERLEATKAKDTTFTERQAQRSPSAAREARLKRPRNVLDPMRVTQVFMKVQMERRPDGRAKEGQDTDVHMEEQQTEDTVMQHATTVTSYLVGAHGEPHQEK
jgi:hypothetical protein